MSSNVKEALNTAGTMTCNLASLTNGSGRAATAIDNSTNLFMDALVVVKIKTGASSTSSTGHIDVYALGTTNGGTDYTDGFAGSDAAITVSAARLIGSFPAVANATTYVSQPMRVSAGLGDILPSKWSIAIVNSSGGTLDSTAGNHSVEYQEYYTTVG